MRHILSSYWDTLNTSILSRQHDVFETLGHRVIQCETTGVELGVWMEEMLDMLEDDDSILFVDCEALALTADIIERAFSIAEAGRIFGVAWASGTSAVYAGSSFLCFRKSTWIAAGKPPLRSDTPTTTAMALSMAARANGIAVELVYPNFVLVPKQPLEKIGCMGVGTFYEEGAVFCLNQPRAVRYVASLQILQQVADAVIAGKPVDYVGLYQQIHRPITVQV